MQKKKHVVPAPKKYLMTNLAATSLPARARGGGELIRTVSNFSGTMRPFEGSLEPCGSDSGPVSPQLCLPFIQGDNPRGRTCSHRQASWFRSLSLSRSEKALLTSRGSSWPVVNLTQKVLPFLNLVKMNPVRRL